MIIYTDDMCKHCPYKDFCPVVLIVLITTWEVKSKIRSILQNIINKIESEEDTTPPEDYFKDIIEHSEELNNKYETGR